MHLKKKRKIKPATTRSFRLLLYSSLCIFNIFSLYLRAKMVISILCYSKCWINCICALKSKIIRIVVSYYIPIEWRCDRSGGAGVDAGTADGIAVACTDVYKMRGECCFVLLQFYAMLSLSVWFPCKIYVPTIFMTTSLFSAAATARANQPTSVCMPDFPFLFSHSIYRHKVNCIWTNAFCVFFQNKIKK